MIYRNTLSASPIIFQSAAALALWLVAFGLQAQQPPSTGFEDRAGASWTSHEEELDFLNQLASNPRVAVDVIGHTLEGRPLHLVRIGYPAPHSLEAAQQMPVELHLCSQHGNEPAGREACLIALRDLAFTDDPTLTALLESQVTLFLPTANPDGRATNRRENALGVDLNRQHLQVDQPEVRAMETVVRDWKPVINMDHHEYGPGQPVLYDDDLLILWPRNLNVYKPLRDAAFEFSSGHMSTCSEAAGYSMDEYGISAADTPFMDLDLQQTAGDWDDGISRNVGGLRHSFGILIESAVSANPANPEEVSDRSGSANRRRRVASQVATIRCTLDWMRDNGAAGYALTRESMAAQAEEGALRTAPTYFDGQDEDTTLAGSLNDNSAPQTFQDPPYCGFLLSPAQMDSRLRKAFEIHDIASQTQVDGMVFVPMGQTAEPVIGLLLDQRGERHLVPARGLDDCAAYAGPPTGRDDGVGSRAGLPTTATTGRSGAAGLPVLLLIVLLGLRRRHAL